MRALLAVVLAALAGCLAPPPPAAPPASAMAWDVEGCAFVIAFVPADAEALEQLLPEGFVLAPGPLAALPAGPRATIELDAYRCRSARWGEARIEDASYGSYYATVEPPAALRDPGYDAFFVKWDALVAEPSAREALAAAGLPARSGEALVDVAARQVSASLLFEGGGGFRLVGALDEPAPPGPPLPFQEFTPLAGGGLARWHARLHDAAIGTGSGVVSLEPGWVRDLVGADRVPATFIAGTWNLDEADVRWG